MVTSDMRAPQHRGIPTGGETQLTHQPVSQGSPQVSLRNMTGCEGTLVEGMAYSESGDPNAMGLHRASVHCGIECGLGSSAP
mmetsp:Transcript_25097/g.68200  ORF Transcript_25097/g.68200 Transcript_25097/m.68200 type:complete len:82 (+) Transcript_25097:1935-2180(+)|eukprot:1160502-Pelagomonas_calceolata.AAC.4